MAMIGIGRPSGGRRLAIAAAASAVFGVLGAVTPATGAGASAIPTWTQQAPASSPHARWGEAMARGAATGTTVLFGGADHVNLALGDIWTWDGATWTKQSPAA